MAIHRKDPRSNVPAAIGAALLAGGLLLVGPAGIAFAEQPGDETGGNTDPGANSAGPGASDSGGVGANLSDESDPAGFLNHTAQWVGTVGSNATNLTGHVLHNGLLFSSTVVNNGKLYTSTVVQNGIRTVVGGQSNGGCTSAGTVMGCQNP